MPNSPRGRNPFDDWPRPLAFALSGGGAFGSVQLGMLRALAEREVHPDLIVGSSIGALHGAVLAAHPLDAADVLAPLWSGANRRAIFGRRRELIANLARTRTLSSFRHLNQLIEETLGHVGFDDLEIRFAAIATDALTGEPDILDRGDLVQALLASAAVPGVFPPVCLDGRIFVDGGVSANVPVRQAIAFGAASVVVLDATPTMLASAVPRGLFGGLLHSASLMLRNQRSNAVDDLAHRHRIAVLPSTTPPDMGSFNFALTTELIDQAYAQTARTLDAWAAETATPRLG